FPGLAAGARPRQCHSSSRPERWRCIPFPAPSSTLLRRSNKNRQDNLQPLTDGRRFRGRLLRRQSPEYALDCSWTPFLTRGSFTRKCVPFPSSDETSIEPLCSWMMVYVIANPSPVPFTPLLVVKNGS